MIQSLKKRLQNQEDGFTLVELLVVIVILGILAAIVVLAVGGITNKGQDSSMKTDKRTLEAAEEAYFAKTDGDNPVYATETELLTGKMLRDPSTKHGICLNVAKTDYTIVQTPNNAALVCPAAFPTSG
jgi:prepilin-type N-terminal cleavage/methylation domain-containing protein